MRDPSLERREASRPTGPSAGNAVARPAGSITVISRSDLAHCPQWRLAFAGKRKDRRFYELVEDTIPEGFDYRYFAIRDEQGEICAVQPFFLLDQDLLVGLGPTVAAVAERIRRLFPSFLKLRTLMVGCVAGEGQLDGDDASWRVTAARLAAGLLAEARASRAAMIVLKEYPAAYREALGCFLDYGFGRIPSLPMTCLAIDYASFDDYMTKALNSATRRKLRKKFLATAAAPAIVMSVIEDAGPVVDEIYPLYLQVYERSKLHFEKLTADFLARLGREMPDKVRFLIWRQQGRIVAFILVMVEGDSLYAEYLGLDYRIALDLHLYFYAVRDMTGWAIANGYKRISSSGLNYDPKLHLRHRLAPIDLYVRMTSPIANMLMQRFLPLIEPTRADPILKKFANYHELWG
jgi:hypothetical protein